MLPCKSLARALGVTVLLPVWGQPAMASHPRPEPEGSAETPSSSCRDSPFRDFDFWLGEWQVTSGGKPVAASSIQSILGGCVILENYSDPSGYGGKSFNFYDSHLRRWRQTWVDVAGNVSEFSGTVTDGAMRYEGETHRHGKRILRRMTVSKLGDDRVRQFSLRSVDEGKTWTVAYDFIYLRVK